MTSNNLSTAARALLVVASGDMDQAVTLPERLPIAAQRAVVKSMLKSGLVEEVAVADDQPAWRTNECGERLGLRATLVGLAAVCASAASGEAGLSNVAAAADSGPETVVSSVSSATAAAASRAPLSARARLCASAEAVLAAWDHNTAEGRPALPSAVEALRAALATARQSRPATKALRVPRTDTKQATVVALLRRPEGATVAQVAETTGWASHTVRGFFAGLKKKGIAVTVLERVRQVGSGKQGAKGSYTIYRVEEVG